MGNDRDWMGSLGPRRRARLTVGLQSHFIYMAHKKGGRPLSCDNYDEMSTVGRAGEPPGKGLAFGVAKCHEFGMLPLAIKGLGSSLSS